MSARPRHPWLGPGIGIATIVALGAAFVALTLAEPPVATYAPTEAAPVAAGATLVGPVLYTVDATAPDRWRYFSFRLGAVVDAPAARDWDLAFRRFHVIANGGQGFDGSGGIRDLGAVAFDAVAELPADRYEQNVGGQDPSNPAIARWYDYGYLSHRLGPKPHVWAVRTATGRYAKLEIVSYYCPGAQPGCVTFRYVYQGDGSRLVRAVARDPLPTGAPSR